MSDGYTIRNNVAEKRFELELDGEIAFLAYILAGKNITLHHTDVPRTLEGRGVGSALARHALETARDSGYKVIPTCPFVTGYLRRHPEFQPLVFGYRPRPQQ